MKKTKKLPENVIQFLDKNSAFNIFGLVNISSLKASTGCTIDDAKLKKLIIANFSEQMAQGEIEFIGTEKYIANGQKFDFFEDVEKYAKENNWRITNTEIIKKGVVLCSFNT